MPVETLTPAAKTLFYPTDFRSATMGNTATGNLSVEAQQRYQFIERLFRKDFAPPASVVELGAAPGDQIARLADLGYRATAVDLGEASDAWGSGEVGRMERMLGH